MSPIVPGALDFGLDITRWQTLDALPDDARRSSGRYAYRRERFAALDLICSSHFDAVGKLGSYPDAILAEVSGLDPVQIDEIRGATTLHCSPHSYPSIILNLTAKARRLRALCAEGTGASVILDGKVRSLPLAYMGGDFGNFRQLFLEMCITAEELRAALPSSRIPKGAVIGVYTDWFAQFNPLNTARFHDDDEMFHPFLMHPYLDQLALDYLLRELEVRGIMTDAPTLEPPVYYCHGTERLMPNVRQLHRTVSEDGLVGPGVRLPKHPFLHIRVICSRCLLLESLELSRIVRATEHLAYGALFVVPMMADSGNWESVPVRALFQRDANQGDHHARIQ